MKFRVAWALLAGAALSLEAVAVLNHGAGDTLSEQIWWILGQSWLIWSAGAVAALVGLYHLFIQKHPD
jgi:hypothetical protein